MLLTRGKRVVAEAASSRRICCRRSWASIRASCSGRARSRWRARFWPRSANNGAHAANGLAALFIATGQDVANISESHAAISYSQLLDNGDYYWSITLPSLIVATYGGGTGLATQKQCLEMLGCYGAGKVNKFAEICAAVVLAGEISLAVRGIARRLGVGTRTAGPQPLSSGRRGKHLKSRRLQRCRGVAQPGSAPALGAGGRAFKSPRPDQ